MPYNAYNYFLSRLFQIVILRNIFMERYLLLFATNLLIVLTLSFIMVLLGIDSSTWTGLFFVCLLFGLGGSLINLQLSIWFAKTFYGVKILDESSEEIHEKQKFIIQRTRELCQKVGLNSTQIGIYHSNEINAFATGPSNSKSLIAYSTGLLDHMNEDEIEGVIAHEIGHIISGDMMTMTLLQGLMNAFVMFAARALATVIDNYLDDEDTGFGGLSIWGYWILVWVLEIIFMLLAYMLISWFSRKREYKADEYSAKLVGKDKMVAALNSLKNIGVVDTSEKEQRDSLVFSKINNTKKKIYFFETHPDLEDRINNLNS